MKVNNKMKDFLTEYPAINSRPDNQCPARHSYLAEKGNPIVSIPYAVVVREVDLPSLEKYPSDWKWEAKIEEVGLLVYGPTQKIVIQTIMNAYKAYLDKGR